MNKLEELLSQYHSIVATIKVNAEVGRFDPDFVNDMLKAAGDVMSKHKGKASNKAEDIAWRAVLINRRHPTLGSIRIRTKCQTDESVQNMLLRLDPQLNLRDYVIFCNGISVPFQMLGQHVVKPVSRIDLCHWQMFSQEHQRYGNVAITAGRHRTIRLFKEGVRLFNVLNETLPTECYENRAIRLHRGGSVRALFRDENPDIASGDLVVIE